MGIYPTSQRDLDSMVMDTFTNGIEWAQKEFINSLWHTANEEPKDDIDILVLTPSWCNLIYHSSTINWTLFTKRNNIEKWCYVDDILPKNV